MKRRLCPGQQPLGQYPAQGQRAGEGQILQRKQPGLAQRLHHRNFHLKARVQHGQRQSIQPQGRRSKVQQGLSRALSAQKPAAQTEAEGRRSKQTKCSDQHEFVSPFAAPAHFDGAAPVSLRFTVFFI